MATTALNSWNAIKTRNAALSKDPKFKPDNLAALCARLDDLGAQLEKQKSEKEKTGKILDDAEDTFEAFSKTIGARYDEIKQITDQMSDSDTGGGGDVTGDDAVKVVMQAAAKLITQTKELAEVAQAIAKASDGHAAFVKKIAEQFKTKREAVDAAIKKIQSDGSKTQDQIKKQIDTYRKIAEGMKDRDLAGDIGSLQSIVSQIYSFQ